MRKFQLFIGSTAFTIIAVNLVFAAEMRIKRSDLPQVVEKTVQEQSVGATIKGFTKEMEDGQFEYEVEMTVNGHGKDVAIAKNGTVLEIEDEIEQNSLPAAVQNALTQRLKGAKVIKVESVTKKGRIVSYEATLMSGARKREIAIGPNGESLPNDD
jgi:hypothetical protein